MNAMKYISLREVGRRLNIPPSTVVYYKDRFERYIPSVGGRGRRRKYPVEALDIFQSIRELYDDNWSAEQIEAEIAGKYKDLQATHAGSIGAVGDANRTVLEKSGSARELAETLAEMVEKMSDLIQEGPDDAVQVRELEQQIELLKLEKQQAEERYTTRISELEAEVESLKAQNKRMEEYILKKVQSDNPLHSKPSREFLEMPLVIRSKDGEYLGVTDKEKKHFTLRNFVSLIQKNAGADKDIDIKWEREDEAWRLFVSSYDKTTKSGRELDFTVSQTVTPSGNTVARLTKMVMDGNTVPEPFLLNLFKQIRDGFDT